MGIVISLAYFYNFTVTDSTTVALVVFFPGNSVSAFAIFRKVGASVADALSGVSFPGSVFNEIALFAGEFVEDFSWVFSGL